MTDNMEAFLEQVAQNVVLKFELDALDKEYSGREKIGKDEITQKTREIAAKYGFTLTDRDFTQEKMELTDEQVEAIVNGGRFCGCPVAGYGGGLGKTGEGWCMCVVSGFGYERTKYNQWEKALGANELWCECYLGGCGATGPNG